MTATPVLLEAVGLHARHRPDAPAVLDGGVLWSWAELDRRADAVAAGLGAAGVAPGERVGLVATSSAGVVAAFHAMVRMGVVIVPLGPRLTQPEIGAIASAARLRAIVGPNPAARPIEGIDVLDLSVLLESRGPAPSTPIVSPGAPAVIVPTSGTTGRPKLVRLGVAQLDASAAAWSAVLPPSTGWLLSLTLAHVSGIGILVRAARTGVPVVVPIPTGADREPIAASLEAASSAGIDVSHVSLVVPQLKRLLDGAEAGGTAPPAVLRAVLLGGGPIPETVVARALAAGWPVVPSYGLTETASGVVAMPLGEAVRRPWSAGRALPGVDLQVAPDGEILVRGAMVFDGYENDPGASAAALDHDAWFHTGDLGSLDAAGWLRVVARRDEIIISGGENVAPAEIEAVLIAHPAVADVAVVGAPDERWGSVPVAFVEFRRGAGATERELRAFALERLASFKVPARIVEVASIPRSASGKLLRDSLPATLSVVVRRPSLSGMTTIEADDGQRLAMGDFPGPGGAPTIVLLHGTLSTSGRLRGLAERLRPRARVLLLDRRGSGASPMEVPAPVSIARHLADVLAVLDAAAVERAVVFGHSFGAMLAIEFAARHPDRVAAVVAYEAPYLPLSSPTVRARLVPLGAELASRYSTAGPGAAAEFFIRSVGGDDAWARLTSVQRAATEAEGPGALADSSMADLDPAGLARIACPVVLATGGASDDFYAEIADALAVRIPASRRVVLPGLNHLAPVSDPTPVAELVAESLD